MPKAGRENSSKELIMATRTSTPRSSKAQFTPVGEKSTSPEVISVQTTEAVTVDATVTASKPTALDRLTDVLELIQKVPAKPLAADAEVKWGKAIGLLGGGSVYINRSNADVRSTTKQVADWAKSSLGVARGPQGQYLRISF